MKLHVPVKLVEALRLLLMKFVTLRQKQHSRPMKLTL
ncbi:hypothetical protein V12B01_13560 [Vibrio splendidus 12B01]|nr:hypothetical protein V12B01_13560 [Vibrio splendidus 12B01]